MATLYETFDRAVTQAKNNWERNFVLPYGSAYATAREKFQNKLDEQKKADEERAARIAALAMFALTLCGGSLLTQVFGSACAKTLAGQFAVDAIARNGMERTWKLVEFVDTNKTAQFFVGKVWDSGVDLLPDMKAKLAETPGNFPSISQFAQNPQVIQNQLLKWVLDAYAVVLATEAEIAKNITNEKLKTDLVMNLIDSPFVRTAPGKALPEDTTADDIEFTFYMNVIRDLDYLAQHQYVEKARGGWSKQETSRRPISESPGDKNYPQFRRTNVWGDSEEVVFGKFGDILRDRVDELHKQRFNQVKFFLSDETISQLTITRAEQKLAQFADINLTAIKATLGNTPSNLHLSSGASGFPLR
jgi:hypothetical protein